MLLKLLPNIPGDNELSNDLLKAIAIKSPALRDFQHYHCMGASGFRMPTRVSNNKVYGCFENDRYVFAVVRVE